MSTVSPVRRSSAPSTSRRPIDTATTATDCVASSSSTSEDRNDTRSTPRVARR